MTGPGPLASWLAPRAAALQARGLTRRLEVRAAGDGVVDLAGNDYLGLSSDPRVVEAAVDALRTWGSGAMASRLVSGTTALHAEVEAALAALTGQPAALVFSSGYLANLGAVTALGGPGSLLVVDAHAHASLWDAARLARSPVTVTPHNDVDAVARALATRTQPRALVLTESVFSVAGDAAPLAALAAVTHRHDGVLLVDEAHGIGVTGAGAGSVAAAGLAGAGHVIVTATLSKALASQGGAVLGPVALREHLVNRARSFAYDTALAPAACAAALAAIGILRAEPDRPGRTLAAASFLAAACGVASGAGAVVPVPVSGPRAAVDARRRCLDRGVRVGCFRPPSVPDGVSRIRLTASAGLVGDALADAAGRVADALEEVR